MKKEWNKIEGALVRFDVGSSLTQALGEGFPAEVICFTTDGNIVFNGIQYSLSQDEYNALVEAIKANKEAVAANTEAIAANAEAIKACQDSIANAGNSNKSLLQISTSLVLPIGGTDPFRVSVEGIAKDANWAEAYGTFPIYNTALNAFLINADLKNYAAWVGYTDIPDSSAYGSTKTLYYDGTKLYRYTGQELVELTSSGTSDTTALENRVKTLEAQLASVMSLLTLQQ